MVDRQYSCPVCGFGGMDLPPRNYNICPCCGTEFGHHDVNASLEQLRAAWLRGGLKWWSAYDPVPDRWDPFIQVASIGKRSPRAETISQSLAQAIAGPSQVFGGYKMQDGSGYEIALQGR